MTLNNFIIFFFNRPVKWCCYFIVFKIFRGFFFNKLNKNHNLKNKFLKKRCFIIGNGPSLNELNLDLIKDEIIFCCNAFYKIKNKNISPNVYCIGDRSLKHVSYIEKILLKSNSDIYIIYNGLLNILNKKKKIRKLINSKEIYGFQTLTNNFENDIKDIDFSSYIPAFRHTPIMAIMASIYMGCNQIILVGMDNSYMRDYFFENKKISHFYPEKKKESLKKVNVIKLCQETLLTFYNFSQIKKYCEKKKIKILDATKNGYLDIFKKVNYADLFKK